MITESMAGALKSFSDEVEVFFMNTRIEEFVAQSQNWLHGALAGILSDVYENT